MSNVKVMTPEERAEYRRKHPGNAPEYDAANCTLNEESPLKGKRIIFLGSSVTFGAASLEQSFIEFLQAEDGIIPWKEAVSGTTLAIYGTGPYVERIKNIPADWSADAFVCQLSTNDASRGVALGTPGNGDLHTVAGAIEYIIEYARETWKCPVFFYTGTKYDSEAYAAMVELLRKLQETHSFGIIDLWDHPMNKIEKEKYDLYMADPIHPTRAGYRDWWTPVIREYLVRAGL